MITFYRPQDPHGHYSNFSSHPVRFLDQDWATSEHAFQAMKYWPHRPDLVQAVQNAKTPGKAAMIGRDRSLPLRPDWDLSPNNDIRARIPDLLNIGPVWLDDGRGVSPPPQPIFAKTKDVFMYEVVWHKFHQHANLKQALLDTGEQPIIEDAVGDPYWGWGASRIGHNKLGRILMLARRSFRIGGYVPA